MGARGRGSSRSLERPEIETREERCLLALRSGSRLTTFLIPPRAPAQESHGPQRDGPSQSTNKKLPDRQSTGQLQAFPQLRLPPPTRL